jgi:hypothetical protein
MLSDNTHLLIQRAMSTLFVIATRNLAPMRYGHSSGFSSVAFCRGCLERRAPVSALCIDVGAFVEEHLDDLFVAAVRGYVERCAVKVALTPMTFPGLEDSNDIVTSVARP